MNIIDDIDLTSIESLKPKVLNGKKEEEGIPKGDFLELSKRWEEDFLLENELIPAMEDLTPLDPTYGALSKIEQIPANVFVSQTISADKKLTFRLYLNRKSMTFLPFILHLLETVPKNSNLIIEITSMGTNGLGVLALLSSIKACKAKVTTHANALLSLSDIAIWASGDILTWSSVVFIILKNSMAAAGGNINDITVHNKMLLKVETKIKNLLITKKIITKAQAKEVFEENAVVLIPASALNERIGKK